MKALSATVLGFAVAGMLFGCSRQAVLRQRLPDGSYKFQCESELPACLSKIDEVCKGSAYVVFGGWDEPKTSGVDQYQVESHRSQVHFRCATPQELAKNLSSHPEAPAAAKVAPAQPNPPPAVTAQTPSPAPSLAPARACVPGSSQACVGVGACAGGQACLPDGSGFGPCDCGSR